MPAIRSPRYCSGAIDFIRPSCSNVCTDITMEVFEYSVDDSCVVADKLVICSIPIVILN